MNGVCFAHFSEYRVWIPKHIGIHWVEIKTSQHSSYALELIGNGRSVGSWGKHCAYPKRIIQRRSDDVVRHHFFIT